MFVVATRNAFFLRRPPDVSRAAAGRLDDSIQLLDHLQ